MEMATSTPLRMMFLDTCSRDGVEKQTYGRPTSVFLAAQCYFHLFTYGLGYLVITVGTVGQLPLLYKILRYQTGKSYISTANITTLFVTNTNFVVYCVHRNLPINTWGEGLLQMALYAIIVNLMLLYHGRQRHAVLFMLTYFPIMVVLLWPVVPSVLVTSLLVINMPVLAWRKINWIYKCLRQKGQTHFSTKTSLTLMNVCCMCRLVTSLADTSDLLLALFYLQECFFNSIITVQCVWFSLKRRRGSLDKRASCPSG